MRGHLPEVTLLEAALDNSKLSAEITAHLGACASCQRRLAVLREDLAAIGTLGTRPAPAPRLRDRILASIDPGGPAKANDGPAPFAALERRFSRLFELDEAETRRILAAANGEDAWEVRGEASYFHFPPGAALKSGAEAGVVRLAPGVSFPLHRHRGEELSLVLRGVLRDDESGREGSPGDLLLMPTGSVHTVTCTSRDLCIFAVLLHGGMPIMETA